MRRAIRLAAFAAALIAAAPAFGNDSTAELTTGGLVLTRNDWIEMRSEDLFISPSQVRVRYGFLNTAPEDQTVLVAFPMPDIGGEGFFYSDVAVPVRESANLLDFKTTVDGQPVQAKVAQNAFLKEEDVTEYLQSLKVPLAPQLEETGAALDRLPADKQAELVKRGLASVEEFDAGEGWEKHLQPLWVLKTAWHWEQTFPAGREIVVEHQYRPSVGGSVGTSVGADYLSAEEAAALKERYCLDADFMAAVKKRQGTGGGLLPERRIAYVLTTGANWAKPIGDFRMVIDKERPDSLVSFCAEGVKKISPTQFEVRHTDFTPKRDLAILILDPAPAAAE